jgi:hypothetical protein
LQKILRPHCFGYFSALYGWTKGLGLFNGRKLAAMAISWVASLIPVVQELPIEVTAGIIAIILITRIEDKAGVSVIKPLSQGKQIGSAKTMLNFNGRREPRPREPLNGGEGAGVRAPNGGLPAQG